jgi:hypothetical protein
MIRQSPIRLVCDRCRTEMRFDLLLGEKIPPDSLRSQVQAHHGWTYREQDGSVRDYCYACTAEERVGR